MSKLKKAFEHGAALVAFVTGGDPTMECCEANILELARAGADIIEIGIPFSDPVTEAPAIQDANLRALKNGTNTDKLFHMIQRVRRHTDVPLVFMTYLNPVLCYGYRKFFEKCAACGIDGIVVPDMPFEESAEVRGIAGSHGVDLISLVAPTTEQRMRDIARQATGYLRVLPPMGAAGAHSQLAEGMLAAVRVHSSVPAVLGCGVHTPEEAAHVAAYADGVLVDSAIVKLIERYGMHAAPHIYTCVKAMKDAMLGKASEATG